MLIDLDPEPTKIPVVITNILTSNQPTINNDSTMISNITDSTSYNSTIINKTTNIPTYSTLTKQPSTTSLTISPKKYSSANHLISNIICIILNFSIIINV